MVQFYVTPYSREASSDNSRQVRLHKFLTDTQITRMAGRPDWIFQTVNEVVRRYEFAFKEKPQVHVVSLGSVNYRADQFMLDPTVNFANITNREAYIMPFVPRTCNSTCPYVVEELRNEGNTIPAEQSPKQRLFQQYSHVGLTEAMEFFEKSKRRRMPGVGSNGEL